MSIRLQVILGDDEAVAVKEAAERAGLTTSEWVRRAMREAMHDQVSGRQAERLALIESSAEFSFPTADIEVMLDEIERGYVE